MDKIDYGFSRFFEAGDRYRLAAPFTHIVAIFFKATKDLTTGLFRVDLSRYQSRCFDCLNKKSYKVCALMIIPIWGFGYVRKHHAFYYKEIENKKQDIEKIEETITHPIEPLTKTVQTFKEEEIIEHLFSSYQHLISFDCKSMSSNEIKEVVKTTIPVGLKGLKSTPYVENSSIFMLEKLIGKLKLKDKTPDRCATEEFAKELFKLFPQYSDLTGEKLCLKTPQERMSFLKMHIVQGKIDELVSAWKAINFNELEVDELIQLREEINRYSQSCDYMDENFDKLGFVEHFNGKDLPSALIIWEKLKLARVNPIDCRGFSFPKALTQLSAKEKLQCLKNHPLQDCKDPYPPMIISFSLLEKLGLFDDFKNEKNTKVRSELIVEIARLDDKTAEQLVLGIETIGLTLEDLVLVLEAIQKLNIIIKESSHEVVYYCVNLYFEEFGFIKKLNELPLDTCLERIADICKLKGAAKGVIINLSHLDFEKLEIEKKVTLYKQLIDASENVDELFFSLWNDLKLEILKTTDKIELVKYAISRGGSLEKIISKRFDRLGFLEDFENLEDSIERLKFIDEIVQLGDKVISALPGGLVDLLYKVNMKERLEIGNKIAGVGGESSEAMVLHFADWGFKGYFQSFDVNAFMKECETVKDWQAIGLLNSRYQRVQNDPLNSLTRQQKFSFCQIIKGKGENVFKALLEVAAFKRLNLTKDFNFLSTYDKRFEFIEEMGLIHKDLVRVFSNQNQAYNRICNLTSKKRVLLYKHIASTAGTAQGLANNFGKLCFNFDKLNENESRQIFKNILDIGEEMIGPLLGDYHHDVTFPFQQLGIDKLDLQEQLSFYEYLLGKGGDYLAKTLINCENIKLDVFEQKVRFKICFEIMRKGPLAAKALAWNLKKLGNLPLEFQADLLRMIRYLSEKHEGGTIAVNAFDPKGLLISDIIMKRQVLLELLLHPEALYELLLPSNIDLKNTSKDINNPFIEPIRALLLFLIRKDEDIAEFTELELQKFKDFLSIDKRLKPLLELFEDAKKKETHEQRQLLKWLAYAAGVCFDTKNVIPSNMFKLIYQYRHPSLRFFLMRQASEVKKYLKEPSTKKSPKTQCVEDFANLFISRWVELGLAEEKGKDLLNKIIENSALFKDTKQLEKLLSFLSEALENPGDEEECTLRYQALDKLLNDKKTCMANLSSLSTILSIFGREKFKICMKDFIENTKTLNKIFSESFQEIFPIKDIPNLAQAYEESFASFRNPTALFVYLGSVNKLLGMERDGVFAVLKNYVEAVLKKDFPSYRYQTESHPHLKKIFEAQPEIQKMWTERLPFVPLDMTEQVEKEKMNYKEFLLGRINEHHINGDLVPILKGYLEGEILLEKALEQLSDESPSCQFQLLALSLCLDKIEPEDFVRQVKNLKGFRLGEFDNDLKRLMPQGKAASKYTIGISDDPQDLLLIGTEVNGSCQRIDGDPSLNKCLVGYFPGDILPIIVKDQNRKIVARSVLRLLWDETNKTAVLLQERLYSNLGDHKTIKEAINGVASDLAKEMKVPLVSKEIKTENNRPYNGNVQFLGGSAPFIYTDAGGGIKNGLRPFEIFGCHEIL